MQGEVLKTPDVALLGLMAHLRLHWDSETSLGLTGFRHSFVPQGASSRVCRNFGCHSWGQSERAAALFSG